MYVMASSAPNSEHNISCNSSILRTQIEIVNTIGQFTASMSISKIRATNTYLRVRPAVEVRLLWDGFAVAIASLGN
jgi:hypothetical protein